MSNEDFKTYALRTLCEEHLWKAGEKDRFFLGGYCYELERTESGWVLRRSGYFGGEVEKFFNGEFEWKAEFFTMNRAFACVCSQRMIH